ncbi:helix-turn-helix transcriptional regulator [Paenibacillus sp. JCM 10914]|uniref:PadR family transcriptional regulator n=1 Tax=Paenibacillus sp. JCM 10914 TaxID=1236974 RepID=UPI0003CC2677|nr:PadR family transcriptional regulator [Paenibacillus sp. JCM 10914]GAE07181.1 transcriptional regulator, PadR family [Paenibacillus sp. JCM 10914]
MYELFVLGELLTGDKHGYMLQEILKNAGGPYRQISSGTLYPLLSRMVDKEWILQLDDHAASKRPRKRYRITDSGRSQFHELMEAPLEYNPDTEHLFHFKMVYFRYVRKEVRLACLHQYLTYLETGLKHVTDLEAEIMFYKPEPEPQRIQLIRVLDHRKIMGMANIEWIKREINHVQSEHE